jgi:hypothetical protein
MLDRATLPARAGRFAVVFVVLLLPVPWLADAYVTAVGGLTNVLLPLADAPLGCRPRFQAPEALRAEGSWKAVLRVEEIETGRETRLKVDLRTFSYRPLAAFVALAAASPVRSRRRRAALWAGGLLAMFLATTAFTALPFIERFALGGAFGPGLTAAVRTAYQALSTPTMVYAMPALVWWLAWRWAVRPEHGAPAAAADARPREAGDEERHRQGDPASVR